MSEGDKEQIQAKDFESVSSDIVTRPKFPASAISIRTQGDVLGVPTDSMPQEFRQFDKNSDGILSVNEIKEAFKHMLDVERRRLPLEVFSDTKVLKQMAKFDADRSGYLGDNPMISYFVVLNWIILIFL